MKEKFENVVHHCTSKIQHFSVSCIARITFPQPVNTCFFVATQVLQQLVHSFAPLIKGERGIHGLCGLQHPLLTHTGQIPRSPFIKGRAVKFCPHPALRATLSHAKRGARVKRWLCILPFSLWEKGWDEGKHENLTALPLSRGQIR